MTFGWGRANRGINFSYVSCCSFLKGFNFKAEVCGLKTRQKKPSLKEDFLKLCEEVFQKEMHDT